MRKMLWMAAGTTLLFGSCTSKSVQLATSSVDQVVRQLNQEEKLHLVIGDRLDENSSGTAVVGTTEKIVPGAAGNTYAVKRLGIPSVVLADGPAGLRIDATRKNDKNTYYCTHFPIATLLASTWNTPLVESVGKAIGNEVKEYGADVLLAPAINIQRNPLCGRNFEYYSEDPLIAGKIGAAYIRGVQSNGVGASLKHFAVNNQETNRQNVDARVSQRALREIYLKGFEIAVKEAKPWTVMSSYNYINGTYASENYDLLSTLLRKEWGFDGIVMTDWYGGHDAVAQMKAGNDLLMPGRMQQYDQLKAALNDGILPKKVFDRNVKRILELVKRTPRFKGYAYSNHPDLEAHAKVTRQSATEGMVLLKNDNQTLPIDKHVKNVALLGCTSYHFIPGGTGSGNVNGAYTVSLLDGLKNAGMTVDTMLQQKYDHYISDAYAHAVKPTGPYARFLPIPLPKELVIDEQEINNLAKTQDIALITLGRLSGEFVDRSLSDFQLSKEENALISSACKAFHARGKKVVVLLNIGGVIETASWKALPDAILCAWQGGQEGGNSVADLLTGRVTPSGKLPMTFPNAYEDVASSANFPHDGIQVEFDRNSTSTLKNGRKDIDYTNYDEDIYVGYRYFDSFNKQVSYPFGYGLSYTSFAYSEASVSKKDDEITVSVMVENTGKHAGKEIVELYVAAPRQHETNKPAQDLKAFAKTTLLQPGEKTRVLLHFNRKDLASFDEVASAWRVDAGRYQLRIGSSSRDIRCTLDLDVKASIDPCNRILECKNPMQILKR